MNHQTLSETVQATPDLDGNKDLFNQLMAKVSKRAGAQTIYCELVVVQMLFHFAREAYASGIPLSSLRTAVDEAAVDVEHARTMGGSV
ncbi:hypothetical protein F9Z43_15040 [Pseudomonas monteilii]|uniref:Uncharacterized protein n=1 Tax=Pseudomonas monteilii TaxID=76759 RepID=A0A7X3F354_9PSED|nr:MULTISPECIES: hypothetical protein [Pseudomonas]MVF50608.1 hypothetical protein [Pseudomonas monteilii]